MDDRKHYKRTKLLKYQFDGCDEHKNKPLTSCHSCYLRYNRARSKVQNKILWSCDICNKAISIKNRNNHLKSMHHILRKINCSES